MGDVLAIVLPWIATTWACFYVVGRDERRLPPSMLARAWPAVSKVSALVGFGLFAVPVHFWRTRRGWLGIVVGLLWGSGLVAVNLLSESLVERVAPPGELRGDDGQAPR